MARTASLLPLLLAACGSDPVVTAENATVADVQAKIREAGKDQVTLTPGRWESTVKIDKVDVPGMPPELAQRMRTAMAGKTSSTCLTPQQARKPAAEFFAGKDRQGCRYDRFEMRNGALDARMTCGAEQGSAVLALKGTYEPNRYRVAMTVDGKGVPTAPQGTISMAMTVDSRRTGECTGREG